MTVRVNKSSFNIREKLSELGRKFGLKGSELAAAETVQEARDLVSAGRKNALYNGDMQIWQRGTTFNNGGGGAVVNYTADRWNSTRYISSENDVSREDANHLGFRYCLRSARGGGDTATTARFVHQVLEQKDTWKLRGKFVTFSFYLRVGSGFNGGLVKSSITYHTDSSREERFHYNQFQNGNNTVSQIEHKSLTTDWQRFTHTTYIPDNAQQVGVAIASNENLSNAVSADYFEVTGCQLEVGRNATEFEHRSYGEELALCQRYYQKMYFTVSDYPFGFCYTYNQGDSACSVPLATPMRTSSPNITYSTLRIRGYNQDGTNGSQAITSASGQTQNSHALLQLNLGHTNVPSAAVGSASVLTNGVSNSTSYLAVDAEL
jgi:hypothetical protein